MASRTTTQMVFEKKQLFGGSALVDVPDTYYDVSKLRQVPDHQEVFQEKDGFDSMIVEIVEFVGNVTATAAARFHLEDYADEPNGLKIWQMEEVKLGRLKPVVPAVAIVATTHLDDKGKSTAIFLLNIRLEQHDTDMLVTVNIKDVDTGNATEYNDLLSENFGSALKKGQDIMQRIVDTFEISDYRLFHPDE